MQKRQQNARFPEPRRGGDGGGEGWKVRGRRWSRACQVDDAGNNRQWMSRRGHENYLFEAGLPGAPKGVQTTDVYGWIQKGVHGDMLGDGTDEPTGRFEDVSNRRSVMRVCCVLCIFGDRVGGEREEVAGRRRNGEARDLTLL